MSNYTADKRIGFAIVNGEVIFQTKDNRISAVPWMKEQLNLTDAQIEETIRGGIFANKIMICKSKDYRPIDMDELTASQFMDILCKYCEEFSSTPVAIHNGCKVGECGEDWEPIANLGTGMFNR